jgi:hypothetical protein
MRESTMYKDISPNKLSDKDQEQIARLRDRLRDEATRQAAEEVVRGRHSGAGGGGNAGGEPQNRTRHGGWGRTGSKSGGGK